MRVTLLSRADLGKRYVRFDPAFYVGQQYVRATLNAESSRIVRLGDIVESIHDGARLPAFEGGIPMIRLNNLRPCELDTSELTRVDGSASKWMKVRGGDVLFTRAAEPFRAAVVQSEAPEELAISSELTLIRPRPAVLSEYLAAILCTPTLNRILRDFACRGRKSALPRLHLSDIQRLPIPLPPRSLQESLRYQYRQAVRLTVEARAEINAVASAIHVEIDHRVSTMTTPCRVLELQRSRLPSRWDVPYSRGIALRNTLVTSATMRPLLELAKPVTSSLRGLSDEENVFPVQARDVNEATFLVEGLELSPFSELSSRMRQRLQVGDVLICTTGEGNQVAYLDEELGLGGHAVLGSATFAVLRFRETARVFAVTLSHPLVRRQLRLLSSGSVQRFVNKTDLDELLVPVLGEIWREDFEARLTRAMQRRREALVALTALIAAAENYLRGTMQ